MKILILSTGTINCEPIIGSLYSIKKPEWDIIVHDYFKVPILDFAKLSNHGCCGVPYDVIIYLSVSSGPYLPSVEDFWLIKRETKKLIHLCFDASCPDWHPLLKQYHDAKVFDLTVNIDGNDSWPHASHDITTLAPIDPRSFKQEIKSINCGFCGGWESPGRREIIDYLKEHELITVRSFIESNFTYEEYAKFMSQCYMIVNMNQSGGGAEQVKARVIEAGLANALLLEPKDSIASKWFVPDIDYLEYKDKEDLAEIIELLCSFPETTSGYAYSLKKTIFDKYSPEKFWEKIL